MVVCVPTCACGAAYIHAGVLCVCVSIGGIFTHQLAMCLQERERRDGSPCRGSYVKIIS